jgi:hypothetical protein
MPQNRSNCVFEQRARFRDERTLMPLEAALMFYQLAEQGRRVAAIFKHATVTIANILLRKIFVSWHYQVNEQISQGPQA